MEGSEEKKFEELLELPKSMDISDFDNYINDYLKRKADKNLAIQELDRILAVLQNHITSLSLYLKQNHIICKHKFSSENTEVEFYTKQDIAAKYRVSIRTVTNWIIDGLETVEIGGVKRISSSALNAFTKIKQTKKFSWKSIAK
ncbi:hypothetical protein SanaruYs_29910 [Chryseotalea sanaruensis]|uniref:Helix-turn-helix domain-containing protein n=1 Tax=Chryseotalea sanaruensis TaxID=2482724 RepID=A0A401UD04_9BACT|nr:helix-turn-helix domain-containing protein [Chryseotalea sanaruensis]GCC52753.1 hypothetical protein SanaruYs_29910 [Chryseotalea sanaruensis]